MFSLEKDVIQGAKISLRIKKVKIRTKKIMELQSYMHRKAP